MFSLFLVPALGDASYLLHLKNGRQLATPAYWYEGRLIFFSIPGGTAGMERVEITQIEEYATSYDAKADSEQTGKDGLLSSTIESLSQQEQHPEQKQAIVSAPKNSGTEAANKEPRLIEEFNALQKKFQSRKNLTLDELKDLKKDLTALRDKIASHQAAEDFREEISKIADMRFFTNDLIIVKSRSE